MRSVIVALVMCFLLVRFSVVSSTPRAGIYIDNGHDQTAIEHLMSVDEKKEIEVEILNLLGLPNRPRKINKALKKSAPRFLLDVYKSLMEKDDSEGNYRVKREAESSDINLSGEEQQQIDESDVIMTFESVSKYKHSPKMFTFEKINLHHVSAIGFDKKCAHSDINSLDDTDYQYYVILYHLIINIYTR